MLQKKKLHPSVIKSSKEVRDFFQIPQVPFDIYLIQSRAEFDQITATKSKNWMVGFTRDKTIFILAEDRFASDSSHPPSDFPMILKHEITHIYYRQLNEDGTPTWLNEGLACFLAGQNKKQPQEKITIQMLDMYHNEGGDRIYDIGQYMAEQILQHYGKEKLFELIKMTNKNTRYVELKKMFPWLH